MEFKCLYCVFVCDVLEEDYIILLGKVEVVQEGNDIILLVWGVQVEMIKKVVDMVFEDGVLCEIIDLCSILFWDV